MSLVFISISLCDYFLTINQIKRVLLKIVEEKRQRLQKKMDLNKIIIKQIQVRTKSKIELRFFYATKLSESKILPTFTDLNSKFTSFN